MIKIARYVLTTPAETGGSAYGKKKEQKNYIKQKTVGAQ